MAFFNFASFLHIPPLLNFKNCNHTVFADDGDCRDSGWIMLRSIGESALMVYPLDRIGHILVGHAAVWSRAHLPRNVVPAQPTPCLRVVCTSQGGANASRGD